jgi:hypothetical protein
MAKNPKKSQTLSEAKDLLFFARREEAHPVQVYDNCHHGPS